MNKIIPILFSTPMVDVLQEGRKTMTRRLVKYPLYSRTHYISLGAREELESPLFAPIQPGDILWVRETFALVPHTAYSSTFTYPYDSNFRTIFKSGFERSFSGWRPSIHMERKQARIFLKVTDVRCEHLHDISEEDIIKEGIYLSPAEIKECEALKIDTAETLRSKWRTLWISINGKKCFAANPKIWVYEFEKIERPTDFL